MAAPPCFSRPDGALAQGNQLVAGATVGSMETRTPSSLKWLVDKRARLAGHIAQIKRKAAAARQRAADLESSAEATLRDLEALDRILGLHDICVPPEVIRPVRMTSDGPLLQRGHISRNVLACLRDAAGDCSSRAASIVGWWTVAVQNITRLSSSETGRGSGTTG